MIHHPTDIHRPDSDYMRHRLEHLEIVRRQVRITRLLKWNMFFAIVAVAINTFRWLAG